MKRFRFAAFCAALLAFTACDVVKQAEGLYNMTQCEYEYDSVTDLSLAGVNLSGELTPLQIARLLGVLGGGASELPLGSVPESRHLQPQLIGGADRCHGLHSGNRRDTVYFRQCQ